MAVPGPLSAALGPDAAPELEFTVLGSEPLQKEIQRLTAKKQ